MILICFFADFINTIIIVNALYMEVLIYNINTTTHIMLYQTSK